MAFALTSTLRGGWEQVRESLALDLQRIQIALNRVLSVLETEELVIVTLPDSPTPQFDASMGRIFRLRATQNRTIQAPTKAVDGQEIIIQHYADGGSNRTLALFTKQGGFRFNTTYAALSATVAGKTDHIRCLYHGEDHYWDIVSVVKGS